MDFKYPDKFTLPTFYRIKDNAPYQKRVCYLLEDMGDKKLVMISGTFIYAKSEDLIELKYTEENKKRFNYYFAKFHSLADRPWIKRMHKAVNSKDGIVFLSYWFACCTFISPHDMAFESNRLYLDTINKPDRWKDMCEVTSIVTSLIIKEEIK